MRRPAPLALALTLSACIPGLDVRAPATDGASLLVRLAPGGEPVEAYAIVPRADLPAVHLAEGEQALLLVYPVDLPDLGLDPGPVPLAAEGGRTLPLPAEAYRLDLDRAAWMPEPRVPEPVRAARLPALDPCPAAACRRPLDGVLTCELPCPLPPNPTPPEAPSLPRLPERDCPPGFVASGPGCAAPEGPSSCPAGTFLPLGATRCEPTLPCPEDRFRAPAGAVFVDAGAAPGGDGTADRPYRTVAEALAGGPADAPIALGPGTFTAPPQFSRSTTLVGRCPRDTTLEGTWTVPAGVTLSLSGLAAVAPGGGAVDGQLLAEGSELFLGGRLDLGPGAVVEVEQARVELGGSAVLLTRSEAHLGLRQAQLVAAGTAAPILQGLGSYALTGVRLTAGRRPLVEATGTGHLERVAAASGGGILRGNARWTVRASELRLESPLRLENEAELDVEDSGIDAAAALFAASGSTRVVTRSVRLSAGGDAPAVSVRDAGYFLVRGARATATGPFLWVHDQGRGEVIDVGLRDAPWGAIATEAGSLLARRVRSDGGWLIGATQARLECAVPGAPVVPSPSRFFGHDLIIDGGIGGVVACPGAEVEADRLEVGAVARPVWGECIDGCESGLETARMVLRDLEVTAGPQTRRAVLQRGGSLVLERARLVGAREIGLYAWGSAVEATDVEIAATAAPDIDPAELDAYCSENRGMRNRGPGSAVMAEAWADGERFLSPADVRLHRFVLRGAQCAGVSLGVDGQVHLRTGRIENNRRGLNFIRAADPTVASDVVFANNTQGDYYGFVPD